MPEPPDSTAATEEEGLKRPGLAGALFRAAGALADFLFPRLCCGCGERVLEPGRLVCIPCEKTLEDLRLPLCPVCGAPDVRAGAPPCDNCPQGTLHFTAARATTPFEGLAKTLVEKLKYQGRVEYAPVMARRMAAGLEEHFPMVRFNRIVPVPLHSSRHRERGFNQSEELGRHLSRLTGIPMERKLLVRVRPTPSQTRLRRRERAENIRDAFACRAPEEADGLHLLLVDDVYTTGATLNECARILRAAGARSVRCLAYARTLLDS